MDREHQWTSIIDISNRMWILAQDDEWEQIAKLESQRQNLIKNFFAIPVSLEESNTVRDGIHKIVRIDKQIITKGKEHKEKIGYKLKDFRTGKKALNAYKVHSE